MVYGHAAMAAAAWYLKKPLKTGCSFALNAITTFGYFAETG
jgi:hypothetical protein